MAADERLQEILAYFEEANWPLDEVDQEDGRLYASMRGRNVVVGLEVSLSDEWQLLQITLTLPELVTSQRIPELFAVINRVNCNLPVGHFELNTESRQIFFYCSAPLTDGVSMRELFESLLAWAADIVDEEHPHIMQSLYSDLPPDDNPSDDTSRRFDA